MIPILFRIGPITVYSYGLMMALGFLAADLVVALECKRRSLSTDYASSLVIWAAICGLVGARVYDILDQWHVYMLHPWSMIFSGSGFVWYGGLIGGIIGCYFVSRRYKISFLTTADMAGPALLVGHALGRVGCYLAGDGDWGFPSKLPWAVAFPNAIVGWNGSTVLKLNSRDQLVSGFYPGVRVHPAMLYETVLYLIAFGIIWALRRRIKIEGRMFCMFLLMAGASRFAVEFIRVNPRVLYGLSEAQIIAVVMMIVGVVGWFYWNTPAAELPREHERPKKAARA